MNWLEGIKANRSNKSLDKESPMSTRVISSSASPYVVLVVQASVITIPIGLQPNVEFNEFQFKFEISTGCMNRSSTLLSKYTSPFRCISPSISSTKK